MSVFLLRLMDLQCLKGWVGRREKALDVPLNSK